MINEFKEHEKVYEAIGFCASVILTAYFMERLANKVSEQVRQHDLILDLVQYLIIGVAVLVIMGLLEYIFIRNARMKNGINNWWTAGVGFVCVVVYIGIMISRPTSVANQIAAISAGALGTLCLAGLVYKFIKYIIILYSCDRKKGLDLILVVIGTILGIFQVLE